MILLTGRQCKGGVNLLEMVLALVIIGILMMVAIKMLWDVLADAERTDMEQVLGGLQSAINLQFAERSVNGLQKDENLDCINPMNFLLTKPSNYLGELAEANDAQIEGAHWYFDKKFCWLVYRVRFEDHFQTLRNGPARARFHVDVVYNESKPGKDGNLSPIGNLAGFILQVVEPYNWREHSQLWF